MARAGQINSTTNGTSTTYIGETGTLTINSGGTLNVGGTGAGVTNLYSAVTVVNNGSIDVTASTATLDDASNTSFTNNGSITNGGTVDLNTDYIDRGSAGGANPVTIVGGTLDDDATAAGGGTYSATGGFILKGTGSNPGLPSTQTLNIKGVTATNEATNFIDDGTITLIVTSGTPELVNNLSTETVTVGSSGAIDSLGTGSTNAYFGTTGMLNIDKGGMIDLAAENNVFYSEVAVTNNGTITVGDGSSLAINADFTQGEFGTLAVTNDVTAGTKSQITGGTDTLGGTLEVTTDGTPTAAYSPISSASSRTGYFGTLDYLPDDYSTAYTTSPNDVTLTPSSTSYEYRA